MKKRLGVFDLISSYFRKRRVKKRIEKVCAVELDLVKNFPDSSAVRTRAEKCIEKVIRKSL